MTPEDLHKLYPDENAATEAEIASQALAKMMKARAE